MRGSQCFLSATDLRITVSSYHYYITFLEGRSDRLLILSYELTE